MIRIRLTLYRSIARQTSCASKCGGSTTVSPENSAASMATWAAPWMSGAAVSRTSPPAWRPLAGLLPLVGQRHPGQEVDAAGERAPQVLVAPHDALRIPGGPAGVDDVDVVGGARREVTLWRPGRQRRLVRGRAAGFGAAAVLDHHGAAQPGRGRRRGGGQRRVPPVADQRHQVGVGEHVLQLVLGVPVVDVDRDGADLARREDRLGRLDGVVRVHADVVTGPDAQPGKVVG